jgi:cell wall-associated NlpC family hydrolase
MEQFGNLKSVMETRDHSKNGASPRSQMSKGNMMRKISILSMIVFFLIAIISCNNNEDDEKQLQHLPIEELDDVMTSELLEALDQLPISDFKLEDIVLPNGLKYNDFNVNIFDEEDSNLRSSSSSISAVDAKNALIKELSKNAYYLTQREYFQYKDEGKNKPAQNGLAFVYGSRDIKERSRYRYSVKNLWYLPCDDYLYGLDCSGYIYKVFSLSKVPLPVGRANDYRQENVLETAFKQNKYLQKIKVDNLGSLPLEKVESGDIVYWKDAAGNAFHMGMFIFAKGGIHLANSAGGPERCDRNQSTNGGPLLRDNSEYPALLLNQQSAPHGYGIVRVNVADAWTFSLRCAGASYDVCTSELSIMLSENLVEEISISCSDYDGSPLTLIFNINYNKDTKILNIRMTLKEDGRVDNVQFSLSNNDSGYVNMQKVNDNGGCYAQMRLVKGNSSTRSSTQVQTDSFSCTLRGNK